MRTVALLVFLSAAFFVYAEDAPPPAEAVETVPECEADKDCPTFLTCTDKKCTYPCTDRKCGTNSNCHVTDHVASCVCLEGLVGNADTGCYPEGSTDCQQDSDCPADQACTVNKCFSPCVGKHCDFSAECQVKDHVSSCVCSTGQEEDPLTGCSPSIALASPSFAPTGPEAADVKSNCTGNTFVKYKGTKSYHVVTALKTDWHNAYMYCVSHGRRLAMIESEEENKQVLEEIKKTGIRNGMFWVDGTDYSFEQRYIWLTTGLPVEKFTYWHANRPSYNIWSNCMEYWEFDQTYGHLGYRWSDRACTNVQHFICMDYY